MLAALSVINIIIFSFMMGSNHEVVSQNQVEDSSTEQTHTTVQAPRDKELG